MIIVYAVVAGLLIGFKAGYFTGLSRRDGGVRADVFQTNTPTLSASNSPWEQS
jgi:hypothetical protein